MEINEEDSEPELKQGRKYGKPKQSGACRICIEFALKLTYANFCARYGGRVVESLLFDHPTDRAAEPIVGEYH